MTQSRLTFDEFEPLLNELRKITNTTQSEAMSLIGYEGSTVAGWRKENYVPLVAIHAIKWILHTTKEINIDAEEETKPKTTLTFTEQADLFGCVQGFELVEAKRRNLIKKLATILSEEGE